MKKTLLAAALAVGFAGVAQAETSVTLYGIIDTGIGYNRIKADDFKATKTGMINGVQSGSRWGLKGAEDLGNGLRAVFQLESGFDSSTGGQAQGGRLFGRQATIGLASDSWGQLDFGRQTNIASKYLPGIVDPFGGGFATANAGASFGAQNTTRYDNMVLYQTPNFSGFQFGVGYSFNVGGSEGWTVDAPGFEDENPNYRAITTGLRYSNGPLGIALSYDQLKGDSRSAPIGVDGDSIKQWIIGASYDFEVVKVSAAFGQTRDGWITLQGYGQDFGSEAHVFNSDYKANSYLVGLSAPVGAGNIMASWHMVDPRDDTDIMGGADPKKAHTYSLGYTYPLSKRTNVYAYGSYTKNVWNIDDVKASAVGVGIRHQF